MDLVDNKKKEAETTEGKRLLNQGNIKMFGEKENFKYVVILESDSIKQQLGL